MANDSVARAMAATAMSETPIYTSDLINDGNGASPFSIVSETGHRIDLECNTADYKLVAKLYDKNNNLLNTSTEIDLPLESLVVNVQYDSANQKLIVTLKNGTTIDVPLGGLITGLATQTWVQSQGYLTQHQSLDGKQDVLPNIVIQLAQIIGQNPITILLTNELAALMENANNSMIKLDLTAVGMSVNYWKKSFISGNNIIFEDTVDNLTQGQISYNTTNKQGVYTTKQIQGKLTAGENITISNNVISATGGGSYTAGDGISIDNNEISLDIGNYQTDSSVVMVSQGGTIGLFAEMGDSSSHLILFGDLVDLTGGDAKIAIENNEVLIEADKIFLNDDLVVSVSGTNDGTNWQTITIDGTTKNIPIGTAVAGTDDGTNWTSITIGSNTKAIPSGGGGGSAGAIRYDLAQSLTESQFNQVMSNLQLGAQKSSTVAQVISYSGSISGDTTTTFNSSISAPANLFNDTSKTFNITIVVGGVTYTTTRQPVYYGSEYLLISLNNRWYYTGGMFGNPAIQTIRMASANTVGITTKWNSSASITSISIEEVQTTYTKINKNFTGSIDGVGNGESSDSIVYGNTNNLSKVTASPGAIAGGYNLSDSTGTIKALGVGSVAFGRVMSSASGRIETQNGPSLVLGELAGGSGSLFSCGYGNICGGKVEGNREVSAGTNAYALKGAFAHGYSFKGAIAALADGATASGYAQATGSDVYARGKASIANGTGVEATDDYSVVIGKWADNTTTSCAVRVGNGSADASRSNALNLDWSGNLTIQGAITSTNIPAPPASDGNYVLKCSIVSGVATYSWVAE